MRKVFVTLVLALMPTVIFAQSAFDKFDGPEEITTVVVTKKMFSMIANVDTKDKEAQQFMKLVDKLDKLRVFTTSNSKYAADMKATSEKYAKSAGLEDLMRINDKGQNIRIMVKSGSKETQVKELVMFIDGGAGKNGESVLMSLVGNFDLNDLSMLTDKMDLPGAGSLKKASKSK